MSPIFLEIMSYASPLAILAIVFNYFFFSSNSAFCSSSLISFIFSSCSFKFSQYLSLLVIAFLNSLVSYIFLISSFETSPAPKYLKAVGMFASSRLFLPDTSFFILPILLSLFLALILSEPLTLPSSSI